MPFQKQAEVFTLLKNQSQFVKQFEYALAVMTVGFPLVTVEQICYNEKEPLCSQGTVTQKLRQCRTWHIWLCLQFKLKRFVRLSSNASIRCNQQQLTPMTANQRKVWSLIGACCQLFWGFLFYREHIDNC